MTELTDLSPTDASNTTITGQSLDGNTANMANMDDTLQAMLGMLGRWTSSDTLASAATTAIGGQPESYLTISGTTTITAFGTIRAGTIRFLRFSGALTLTHNATSLILPGGANITTAAGDTATFVSEGSGNWRCLAYQRAVTVPVRPQAWELISTQTISSSTAVMDFTGLSAYRLLRLSGYIIPETDNVNIFLRTSTDNGSTFDAGATDYSHAAARAGISNVSGNGLGSNTAGGASAVRISGTLAVGGANSNEGTTFRCEIHEFNQTLFAKVNGDFFTIVEDGTLLAGAFGGTRLQNTARNAIRLLSSSGNIARAFVTLEGIRG